MPSATAEQPDLLIPAIGLAVAMILLVIYIGLEL